jgi:hypothetical protein
VNILAEKLNQFVSLFFLVLNISGSCSFSKEFHEAALHHDPEHPWQVKDHSHEYEVERDPLVVGIVHYCGSLHVLKRKLIDWS